MDSLFEAKTLPYNSVHASFENVFTDFYASFLLLYKDLRSFLKIFPAADLGIISTNSIPPSNRLYSATCSLTNLFILSDISSDSTILFTRSVDNGSLNTI